MSERTFPLQADRAKPGPLSIHWSIAEKAYSAYVQRNGRSQSLEQIAARSGFGWGEMDLLYPAWREECDELVQLRAQLATAQREREALVGRLSQAASAASAAGMHRLADQLNEWAALSPAAPDARTTKPRRDYERPPYEL